MTASSPPRRFRLSEDWLATIIGLVIVGVVGLGLLGPGAQKHELKAAAGEDANAYALPLAGWKISATVDGEKVTIADAPTTLEPESVTAFTCEDGELRLDPELAATISARPEGGKATLLLVNQCDAPVAITYSTSALIRWPLFGLLGS